MKRLLILPAVAALCVAEMYRRGFVAPVLFGWRQWARARPDRFYQPDPAA